MNYKELKEQLKGPLQGSKLTRTISDMLVGPKADLASRTLAGVGLAALFGLPYAAHQAKRRARDEISKYL